MKKNTRLELARSVFGIEHITDNYPIDKYKELLKEHGIPIPSDTTLYDDFKVIRDELKDKYNIGYQDRFEVTIPHDNTYQFIRLCSMLDGTIHKHTGGLVLVEPI